MTLGTPKNLDECIIRILSLPMYDIKSKGFSILQDFLAQRFGAAYLKADGNDQALEILKDLYTDLIKRPTAA